MKKPKIPKESEQIPFYKQHPDIFANKETDFSLNYFTNMDTQIESVKHSIPLNEEAYKEKTKKNLTDRETSNMQISIESFLKLFLIIIIYVFYLLNEEMFMENEASYNAQHKQLDLKCSFDEEEEEEMEENNNENHFSDNLLIYIFFYRLFFHRLDLKIIKTF